MKKVTYLALTALAVACSQPKPAQEETAEVKIPTLTQVWASDTTVLTPESVLFDKGNNILYVSCINGVPPTEKDGDGYIAKMNPADGSIIAASWVAGLDAPKGMGLVGNALYVANISEVWVIDITTGEVTNKIAVDGAQFLNDITTDGEGNVYVSDSNTNKIHKINSAGEVSTWIESADLGGPNGLLHDGDRMLLATFGTGNFNTISYADNTIKAVVDSIPGGDGVVKVGTDFLVSNWNGEVYYVTSDWSKTKLLDTKEAGANAADIEFDEATMTLFVPTFFGNQVVAYKLAK